MQTFSGFLDNLVEQKCICLLVDFQFYPIVKYVYPYASMTLFDYCNFMICFEIRNMGPPLLLFLINIILAIWDSL